MNPVPFYMKKPVSIMNTGFSGLMDSNMLHFACYKY